MPWESQAAHPAVETESLNQMSVHPTGPSSKGSSSNTSNAAFAFGKGGADSEGENASWNSRQPMTDCQVAGFVGDFIFPSKLPARHAALKT